MYAVLSKDGFECPVKLMTWVYGWRIKTKAKKKKKKPKKEKRKKEKMQMK